MGESGSHRVPTLRDHLQVAKRWKWVLLAADVLVPAAAVYLFVRQQKLYEASAQVYMRHVVRRPMLRELRRVLDASPTAKLGYVVTGAHSDDAYYGYQVYSYYTRGAGRVEEQIR